MKVDPYTVLERMAAGEFAAHIAKDLGVTKQAVSKRLLRCATVEYRTAMRRGASVRLLALLRRIRDGDIDLRKELRRELLYCERWASNLLQIHAGLIRSALRLKHRARTRRRRFSKQSEDITAELVAMERLRKRCLLPCDSTPAS